MLPLIRLENLTMLNNPSSKNNKTKTYFTQKCH